MEGAQGASQAMVDGYMNVFTLLSVCFSEKMSLCIW